MTCDLVPSLILAAIAPLSLLAIWWHGRRRKAQRRERWHAYQLQQTKGYAPSKRAKTDNPAGRLPDF